MLIDKPSYKKFNYDEHARSCAPKDFSRQTCRTVQGEPLPDDQVQMIISAIESGLKLKPDDILLELACGNGSLTQLFFNSCKAYLGVDVSKHLVAVAKENFERMPHHQFSAQGAIDYVRQEQQPVRFTKMLCYAGFQYFPDKDAAEILRVIYKKFNNILSIYIGSLPDKNRVNEFYQSRQVPPITEELADCCTAIGMWRTKREFEQLAGNAGWRVTFSTMPTEYYASSYRYDALLRR